VLDHIHQLRISEEVLLSEYFPFLNKVEEHVHDAPWSWNINCESFNEHSDDLFLKIIVVHGEDIEDQSSEIEGDWVGVSDLVHYRVQDSLSHDVVRTNE